MSDNLPRMDYRQHQAARRLVHECCNYDEGNCLLLDDGEPCVCRSYASSENARTAMMKWGCSLVCCSAPTAAM